MTTPDHDPDAGAPETAPEPPRYGQYAPGNAPLPTGPAAAPGSAPQYGGPQYGGPQYGAPQYGAPGQPGARPSAPGYGPPASGVPGYGPPMLPPAAPRPGIIPLRPLSLGDLYDGAFRAIRHNPKVMLGLPALLSLLTGLVGAVFGVTVWSQFSTSFQDLDHDATFGSSNLDVAVPSGGALVGLAVLGILVVLVGVMTSVIIQGVTIANIGQSVLGRKPTVGAVWAAVRGRMLGGLIVISLFLVVVPTASVVVLILLIVVAAQISTGVAVTVGLLGLLAVVAGCAWFLVRVVLAAPAYVLEHGTVRGSIGRVWRLTHGSFWRVLGIGLLTAVLVSVLSAILRAPATVVTEIVAAATASSGSSLSGGALVGLTIASTIFGVVSTVVSTAFVGGVSSLLYIDLRMRREGLDVSLAAAAASDK